MTQRSLRTDLNGANVSAGLTAVLWYAFGPIPLFLSAMEQLGVTAQQASSWFFITFFTAAVANVILVLRYRQPIAVGWTFAGLVFLATAGQGYDLAQLAGANLAAGILILLLGRFGLSRRLLRWLPLPLVLAVFAGSVLRYATGIFVALGAQSLVVGAALVGYLGARAFGAARFPPVGAAVVLGIVAASLAGQFHPEAFAWRWPAVHPVLPAFSPASVLTLTLPLVVLTVGTGNVQAFGVMSAQGYRPPVNLLTTVTGAASIVNALFGGHPASIQRAGTGILAGEEVGPLESRYVAAWIAAIGGILIAACAAGIQTLPAVLPPALIAALAGLAILPTLLQSLKAALTSELPTGAFFAFAIAASPLNVLGIGAAFWALVGGYVVSLCAERSAFWRVLHSEGAIG